VLEGQVALSQRTQQVLVTAVEQAQAGAPFAHDAAWRQNLYPLRKLWNGNGPEDALVLAVMRQESNFSMAAISPAGARGLMQLMPATARYIGREEGLRGSVNNPADNLALGQAYVRYLGEQAGIDDNLLAVLASYNAGPGAAAPWYQQIKANSDPLMFIESIPTDQTRRFVKQVLADSWLYAEEIGLKPASLDALAAGNFPSLNLNIDVASAN
jgi:soluble lytic murein transglycosylase-like protein